MMNSLTSQVVLLGEVQIRRATDDWTIDGAWQTRIVYKHILKGKDIPEPLIRFNTEKEMSLSLNLRS
jgi:hypothetical protein